MLPTMIPVASSNITHIGHDKDTNTLHVQFAGKGDATGGHYSYAPVSRAQFDALCGAESIGSHFHTHIKSNKNIKHEKMVERALTENSINSNT